MNNTSIYLSDLCEPDTARHDLCTNGGCECPCHKNEHEIDEAVWRLMIERGPDVRVFEISGELDLTHEEVVAAIKRLQVTKRDALARRQGPEEAG